MPNSNSEASLRLKNVFEAAIDGIITMDEIGTVDMINPAAAHLFGYSPEEVIGQNVKMLMPTPYRVEHDGYLKRYRETDERRIIGIGREVKGRRKDGSIFPLRLSVGEVLIKEGKRIFTGIIHDLTEVKEAEKEVLKLNQELEQKNQELEQKVRERTAELDNAIVQLENALGKERELSELKSRFVSMASHEFKTPLATILSSIELIEMYKAEDKLPKREKHINRVKSAVNHLNNVLLDFLSIARLEEGKIQIEPVHFDLREFLRVIEETFAEQLKPGQRLLHRYKAEGTQLYLDKKFLRHILFNLLSNAIKYSPEDSPIDWHTEVVGEEIVMKIQDYGIGIPEEEQKHLFTRFFRAHNVENIKGTGLGLNIVKHYTDVLKGRIDFESKQGEGTLFIVYIPLVGDL